MIRTVMLNTPRNKFTPAVNKRQVVLIKSRCNISVKNINIQQDYFMHPNRISSNHSQSRWCVYLALEERYRVCNYR